MKYVRAMVFLAVLMVIYRGINDVFILKSMHYRRQVDFLSRHDMPLDILSVGSSYVFYTVNPVIIYEELGLRAYTLGSPQQSVEMSYYYAKEAISRSHPKVLIIGATMFVLDPGQPYLNTDAYIHMGSDVFPVGLNRLLMLASCNLPESMETYLFPLMKYHGRWKSLRQSDFDGRTGVSGLNDVFNGSFQSPVISTNVFDIMDAPLAKPSPVFPGNLSFLAKFKKLADANGCRLLLISSPRKAGQGDALLGRYQELFRKARELGADVIDLSHEARSLSIVPNHDFHGFVHMNMFGSEKCTRHIAQFIKEQYHLAPSSLSEKERQEYEMMRKRYYENRKAVIEKAGLSDQ